MGKCGAPLIALFLVVSALGKIIECSLDINPLLFWRRAWMSLLDSRVNVKASIGELSGSLPKASAGISAASARNKKENFLATIESTKEELKISQ